MDLTNTFHQIRIQESNKWKTTFYIQYSHFEYQVILFKLFNALTIFQSSIKKILAKKLNILGIIYLNNIFIYTKDLCQSHIEAVWLMLNFIKKKGFFANLKNCRFYQNKIHFLAMLYQLKKSR